MKETELRKHAVCNLCGNKVGATGLPLFWRVTVERFGMDMRAMQRQTGLAMMVGHAGIAQMMGPDEDMAKPMMDPAVITVCENCCTASTCVAALAEQAPKAPEPGNMGAL
jgi:hypothetical protein